MVWCRNFQARLCREQKEANRARKHYVVPVWKGTANFNDCKTRLCASQTPSRALRLGHFSACFHFTSSLPPSAENQQQRMMVCSCCPALVCLEQSTSDRASFSLLPQTYRHAHKHTHKKVLLKSEAAGLCASLDVSSLERPQGGSKGDRHTIVPLLHTNP